LLRRGSRLERKQIDGWGARNRFPHYTEPVIFVTRTLGGIGMSIQTSTRVVDGVAIVDITGQLRLGEGTGKLREVVKQLVNDGYRKILLNMSGVIHIDSTGIGELVSNFTTLSNQGGELKLMSLNKNVRNLLQITRLFTVFDVHDDQVSAVKAFK
jgi:anti-sigma B factor antagonist